MCGALTLSDDTYRDYLGEEEGEYYESEETYAASQVRVKVRIRNLSV
jgi:hypothetical protein